MRTVIISIAICLLSLLSHAQQNMIFTTERGLSSSLINELYQDNDNMIWIATEYGLNRYDGAKFVTYMHDDSNPNSLCHNYVHTLFGDSHGRMYVGTYDGLQLYDPATDCFSEKVAWADGRVFDCHVTSIMERRNGEIWVAGNELCKLDIKDGRPVVSRLSQAVPTDMIDYMLEDSHRNVWLVQNDNGVFRLSNDGTLSHFMSDNKGVGICGIFSDMQGDVYVATLNDGLMKYDAKQGDFIHILYKGKGNLPVKTISQYTQNELYLGTDGRGVKVFDIRKQAITDSSIDNSYFDTGSLKVHSILTDNAGNLWMAIYQKGIMMIPAQQNNFRSIGNRSADYNVIGSNCITSLMRTHDGTLWVGTDNDGLYALNTDMKGSVHYKADDSQNSVPATVFGLYEDSENNLWVGSYTKGLARIDRKTGRCTYLNDLIGTDGKKAQRVFSLAEDNSHRLWIATMGGGLFYYDINAGRTVCDARFNNLNGKYKWIDCLLYSSRNKLYVGTYDGVRCIDLSSEDFAGTELLTRHIIFCMHEDRAGNVWIGHSDGLTEIEATTGKPVHYSQADGLPSGAVYAIEGDNNGNVWMSTNSGLSRFDIRLKRFINYYVNDGLRENEFSKNASFADADGTIWFGGMNSIVYFKPQEIINPAKKWTARVTDFYLHNKPVRKGVKSGRRDVIDCPVYDATDFYLSHSDNSFSIEFATQELSAPERVEFLYSMNGGAWTKLPKGVNSVSFSELSPGDYSFRIKAVDCMVESDAKEINIHIASAWWATWWALALYVLIALSAICAVVMQLIHRYRTRQEMMQHIHAEQINEAKLQFFINISHEIRTPMSLIINPLQKLMSTDTDRNRQKIYRVIYRNSERILRLVNQLMDIRKIDKGQMALSFRNTEMVGFVNDICDTFAEQMERKHITLTFNHDGFDTLMLWVDPANFDKIIMNMLSNSLKFTPDGGRITISLKQKREEGADGAGQADYAEFTVADTGIGIEQEEMEHIFERFYQIRNSQNNSNVGTGIGLHLTRSLVELHHGTIVVANNSDGPGCRFVISIPMGRDHLRDDELSTEDETPIRMSGLHLPIAVPYEEIEDDDTTSKHVRANHSLLVVEDDEEIRRYIISELSDTYKVAGCSNGREALDMIFKKMPHLVISDVMMPEMDGLTLCRKIKQNINLNHIPVVLLTAKTREEDNIEGLESGADAYMAKPFNVELLRKTVENLIKSRERMKNTFGGKQVRVESMPVIEARSADDKLMERVMKVINDNLSNPDLTVEMIANEVCISRVHLHRKLKELTNQTTRDFIRNVRLRQAADLLSKKHYAVSEVADMTGFSNPNTFSTAFKELYGVPPTVYMEQHLAQ